MPPRTERSASTDPPCWSTSACTIDSPRPEPPCMALGWCGKRSNGRSRMDAGSPGPASLTASTACPAAYAHFHADPAPAGRVAQGVFHEVGEDLAQPVRVGHDQLALRGGGQLRVHLETLSASLASKPASASPTSATRSTGRVCSDSRPTEASDSVQVRDQAAQVQGLVQQAAHFLVADRDDAVADRVQAGAEHRDGRAQLVRDGGQRHALFPVQRFERIDHVIEIPHHFGHFAACLPTWALTVKSPAPPGGRRGHRIQRQGDHLRDEEPGRQAQRQPEQHGEQQRELRRAWDRRPSIRRRSASRADRLPARGP